MLKIYFKLAEDTEIQELSTLKEGCWIHIDEATMGDLENLSQLTGIEYADLQDSLDKYEIPRIERSDHNLLIFTRSPIDQEIGLYTSTFTLILSDRYFITICPHHSLIVQNFLWQKNKFSTTENTKLLIQLLTKINLEFTAQIRQIRHKVSSAEKEMIAVESEDIAVLTKNEEVLNQYLSSLAPTQSVLNTIRSGKYTSLYEKEQDLLEDCILSIRQSEELCAIVIKSIRSLRDAYQIIFTNNLHKTIKLLTALTIILSIPTMIASIYGMNLHLPLSKNPYAFTIVLLITLGIAAIALWIFKKKKWL